MNDDLTFYTNPMSRGRIVRWMLEEVGQPYETVLLDYGTTMKAPAYLAINPMGKVPAIRHGDTVVTEAGAICAYLADAFPAARLAPPSGHRLRGTYYRWLFYAAGPVVRASFLYWVVNQNISGVFQSPPHRIMLDKRLVYEGQEINPALGITFDHLDLANKLIVFRDKTGALVTRSY